jgi:hypothetical protein
MLLRDTPFAAAIEPVELFLSACRFQLTALSEALSPLAVELREQALLWRQWHEDHAEMIEYLTNQPAFFIAPPRTETRRDDLPPRRLIGFHQ